MFNPGNYSQDNLGRIKKVIKIILDEIEIQGIVGYVGNKIPLATFLKDGFTYEYVVSILNLLKTKEDLSLKIGNEEIKRMVKPASYIYEDVRKVAEARGKKELLNKLKLSEEELGSYIFIRFKSRADINKLQEIMINIENYSQAGIIFPPNETVMYLNKLLFFKLGDGTSVSIDFNNAPTEQRAFECFWNLRLRRPGETEFTPEEIGNIYVELHKNNPDTPISRAASAIRKRHRNKPALKERLLLAFDRIKNKWIFDVK